MELQSSDPFTVEVKQQAAEKTEGDPNHNSPPLPELRLVLLGRKGTGKSCSGNTILSTAAGFESGKPTEECVKRRADVASYRVTVVDTPGWEWYYSGNGTPGWVTRETMRSVTVCSPGPHALLLVIRSSASVTEDYYRQVEEHLEVFGKTAWGHTMLLFTRGDELGSIPIEQRIQNAGKSFQKLFERCENRFHVLENKRKDDAQVKELIRKIEEMIKERGGRHYESDPLLLGIEVEGKRRARERRKKQRIMETQAQKGIIKAVLTTDVLVPEGLDETSLFSRGSRRLPELRLVLLGERETGKSSAGNTILRGPRFFKTGQATEECTRQQAEISGRMVTVVDVPGWEGGPEGITPDRIKREICASVTLCPPGPHVLLLTLRVDALVRVSAVREHLELLGEGIWRHTLLLFTRGDHLREGVSIEQHIQGGGKDLHWLMDKCGNRYHVISSIVWEGDSSKAQVTALLEKIEKMVSVNRCEAFSPVVQEIRELGKQKNERLNMKLKEVNEKLQRQELELKRMREREVKSIRRIFDWRKDKVKSPEKTTKEREEGMDRSDDDRKSIMSELEERMVWLTEDKEREIQELSLENSSLIAALNQGYKEREEIIMKLDEKEKESEELKEKVDELQVNVLELKRFSLFKEQEKKEKEEELIRRYENGENELKGLRGIVKEMQKMITESKLKYEEEILNKKQEQEKRVAENDQLEKRLKEKQKEMEVLKLTTENNVRQQEERMKEMNETREKEKIKLREMIELMTKEMEELQGAYREQVKASESARQIHEDTVLKYNELIDKLVVKDAEFVALMKKQNQQEMAKNVEIQNKLKDKDAEISDLDKKLKEKEQKIEALKQTIDGKNRAMENVKNEHTCRIKDLENEYKEMEEFLKRENVCNKEEIEAIKKSNKKREDDTRKLLEVKENVINHLRQEHEENGANIKDLKRQLKEVQIKVDNLLNQKAALIQEIDGFHIKCADYERDLQLQIIKNESSEKDIKDILHQAEEIGKIKDTLNQENIKKKEHEICLLKQRNQAQQTELDAMNDKIKELEKKNEEMKKYYEERFSEMIAEMGAKDAEREQRLHSRQMEMDENEQNLRENMQELEKGKKELKKRDNDVNCREKELKDKKQQLDKKEHEINEKENKLKYQYGENQKCQENLENREIELTKREKSLERKHKEQIDLSQKQDLERENIKKQLEENKNLLKKREEELALKQSNLQDQLKELECQRKSLDIRDEEYSKREQDLITLEQVFEVKMQELAKGWQELKQKKQDVEKWQAELTAKEEILKQRSTEFQKAEQNLLEKEHGLQIKRQNLLETTEEVKAHEQELLKKHEIQAASHDQMKNELETIKDKLEIREQKLRSMMDVLDNQEQEFKNRETGLNIKEMQIAKKCEEYESAEKSQKEFFEKQEKELENVRQHIEENKKELIAMQDELLVKQTEFKKEKKDFDGLKEFRKREQELLNLQQMCDFKAQELSKEAQELEKRKDDNEKWQAELTNKEYDLLQQLKELALRENNLQLKKQELLGINEKATITQHEDLNNQHNQMNKTWEGQFDDTRALLAKREQDLTKKEDELQRKEENIRSAEIYLDKREMMIKKKETEVQTTKEQNDHILGDLKKKQELLDEMKCSLETKQRKLGDLEKELGIRENDITNKQQELSKRKKNMDIKEHKMEKFEQEIESRNQEFKKKEQELNELNLTMESKEKYIENHTATLENQKSELNVEKQILNMKSEQLEKWGKYLYNKELKMINSNSSPDFKPWDQHKVCNITHSMNIASMSQELGTDVAIYEKENGNSSGAEENDQVVKMGTSSKTTHSELASQNLAWLDKSRRLEIKMKAERKCGHEEETGIINKEKDVEEFFQPASSDSQVTQGLFYQHSELKLMLIGESWSPRQSATRTILGQDVKVGSPWRGEISGKPLLVVEPHGIKWRCSRDINIRFQKDLVHSISLCTPGPHAFILLLPAYLTFTRKYRKAVEYTMATLGEVAWRHTIVLFTWAEALGESGQQHIQRNGDLEWLIQKCGGRYNVLDNRHREAHVEGLLEMIYEMVEANHGHYYKAQ